VRAAAARPAVLRVAWAQAYPTRPVRIIVGFPAGSASDIIARLTGQWLQERLGQPFVIENRPGAANNIATEVAHGNDSANKAMSVCQAAFGYAMLNLALPGWPGGTAGATLSGAAALGAAETPMVKHSHA
jgi:tripartite-type tricarboxylate transporter receptor subunit TctC